MALDSLTAKANVGAGTDALAGVVTPEGFAGAVALVDASGALVNGANPVPVASTDLATIAGAVKAEDSPHVSGDAGIPLLGVRSVADAVTTDRKSVV